MSWVKSFKEFIGESLWTDIQRRSAGDTIRKEDEVTYSTLEDEECTTDTLYKYLIKNYTPVGNEKIELNNYSRDDEKRYEIHIPITLSGENVLTESSAEDGTKIWSIDFTLPLMKYVKKMNTVLEIDDTDADEEYPYARAYTNHGLVICNQVVDFLDEILDLVPDPALKKAPVNESLWTDIQKRSAGDTIRKEDDRIELKIYSELKSLGFSEPILHNRVDDEFFAPYKDSGYVYMKVDDLRCNCDCYKNEELYGCLISHIFIGEDMVIDRDCFSADPEDIPEDYDSFAGIVMYETDHNTKDGEVVGLSYSKKNDLWTWIYNSNGGELLNNECDKTLANILIKITKVINPNTIYTPSWFRI